jgi:ankyrin repeat protein
VESLLKLGLDVNGTTEPTGLTPLHLAAGEGHLDIVKLLLEHGADINARSAFRVTPLALAARDRQTEVAAFLISKGALKK